MFFLLRAVSPQPQILQHWLFYMGGRKKVFRVAHSCHQLSRDSLREDRGMTVEGAWWPARVLPTAPFLNSFESLFLH